MDDEYHFEGDPATESTRRHLERVLQSPPHRRRWPFLAAAIASGTVFALWRRQKRRDRNSGSDGDKGDKKEGVGGK